MVERDVAERVYEWVTDEDAEGSACEGIPEEACREAPRSFLLNLANGAATKLAEQLASPDLVLVWFLSVLGAPVFFSGMLEPVRRGAAMFPQLAVSGRMRAYGRRKWFWVGAGVLQAVTLVVMLVAGLVLSGGVAGVVIVAALLVFSVASGVGSVAFKDVMGKTIPKGKRGQLLGLRSSIGGALTIAAGLVLYGVVAGANGVAPFVALLGFAAVLWALAAGLFARIEEQPGATGGGRNALSELRHGWRLLTGVRGFRWFILSRGLLLSAELSIPFYTLRARQITGAGRGFGLFVVALGVAALIGGPVWGRISDLVSSRLVLVAAGLVGALAAAGALSFGIFSSGRSSPYLYALIFLVVGFARDGVRVGRKSYVVDASPPDERPLYTATANTASGVLTFMFITLGFFAQAAGVGATLAVLLVLGLLGAAAAWRMPEAGEMVG
ncbi:MAG: MFS transporter [Rubrobacteraceae bacterium]|nr:MFS transporter [Rubrobacteraceae bacterium]